MFTSWEWKETPLFDIWSSHPEPASPSPPQRGCFPWHHTPHLAPLHWGVATVCQSLGLFMPHPEHLKPSYIQCNVFNILMSYLQLRLKLKKKGERDTFMSAFQFAELWINWASIMRLFFVKMKQARVQSVQCWIWGCTTAIWASNGSFSMDFGWTLSGQPKPSAATH